MTTIACRSPLIAPDRREHPLDFWTIVTTSFSTLGPKAEWRPAARRALVHWAREAYQVSERRTCCAVGVERSLIRYRSRRPAQQPLRTRLRELASVRLSAGYQQLHVLLRRKGWRVNHKRCIGCTPRRGWSPDDADRGRSEQR